LKNFQQNSKEPTQTPIPLNVSKEYEGKVICSHCESVAVFRPNKMIYGRKYGNGMAWICLNFFKKGDKHCDSYVGCHADGRPLGTPANKQLRQTRYGVHEVFDPLWQLHGDDKRKNNIERSKRYSQLARFLNIKKEECHIGMFDLEMCSKALEFVMLYNENSLPNHVKLPKHIDGKSKLWTEHVNSPIIQEGE
jgi:hypothetical protein